MNEEQLITIETKIAYQEDLVQRLNELVIEQQRRIDQLENICRQLVEQYKRAADAGTGTPPVEHEIPPHY